MYMTNETVKLYPHDRILNAVFVRFLPKQLHPNHVTLFRFLLIPPVLWLIGMEYWTMGVPLFVFAAFTDAVDGTMARIRKQITTWGTFADPAADKLLIGTVVIIFVAKEINWTFALIIVGVELLILLTGAVRNRKKWVVSANWAGKFKMLFQVAGVSTLLIAKWTGIALFVPFSVGTLSIAIVFAVVSLLTYSL